MTMVDSTMAILVLVLVIAAQETASSNADVDDTIIYIDEVCMEQLQTEHLDVRIQQCEDTFSLAHSPPCNSILHRHLYNLDIYRLAGTDVWAANHSWADDGTRLSQKFMYKAKFASQSHQIRSKDNLCVRFQTIGNELMSSKTRTFPCLRIKTGEVGALYVKEVRKEKTCEKYQINTECSCPDQEALAFRVHEGLVSVKIFRQPHTSGFQVTVIDLTQTRSELYTSDKIPLAQHQNIVEYKQYTGDSKGNLTVKVRFWCSNYMYTKMPTMDKECSEFTVEIAAPETGAFADTSETQQHLILSVALLSIVVIVAVITCFVFKRRGRQSDDSVGQTHGIPTNRTNYSFLSPGNVQVRHCVILYQPPSSGQNFLHSDLLELERIVEARGIQVCSYYSCVSEGKSQYTHEHWSSFTETIVSNYDYIIFVASSSLNSLLHVYNSVDEQEQYQHDCLLESQNEENIPIKVINLLKARQMKSISIKPKIYVTALSCRDTLSLVPQLLKLAPFLSSIATVYCLEFRMKGNCCKGHRQITNDFALNIRNHQEFQNSF